jgi:hypothetical protein
MKNTFLLLSICVLSISCSSPDIRQIANELCDCKQLPENEGEKCFLEWEEKHAQIRLSESQKATFDGIVIECMQ